MSAILFIRVEIKGLEDYFDNDFFYWEDVPHVVQIEVVRNAYDEGYDVVTDYLWFAEEREDVHTFQTLHNLSQVMTWVKSVLQDLKNNKHTYYLVDIDIDAGSYLMLIDDNLKDVLPKLKPKLKPRI